MGLALYVLTCLLAYRMNSAREFYVLACLVGLVQGGTQALSRALFASLIPKHKSGEFFGFFSVFEKFGGLLGPAVFEAAIRQSGSSRVAIFAVAGFFVLGAVVLSFVNVADGEREAAVGNLQVRIAA